jgi:sec-independent protein translocase protein TatA
VFRNGLEPWHLIIVLVVVFLLFGAKRMPDTARALGKSLRILKSETRALKEDFKEGHSGENDGVAHKTIKAAPGESAARQVPVAEPEPETTQR